MSALTGPTRRYPRGCGGGWGKKARSPGGGEYEGNRFKTIACGNAGVFRCDRGDDTRVLPTTLRTRLRVQRAPGIPHALIWAKDLMHELGRNRAAREAEVLC